MLSPHAELEHKALSCIGSDVSLRASSQGSWVGRLEFFVGPWPKAMPDYYSKATHKMMTGGTAQQAREDWRALALSWWAAQAGEKEQVAKVVKLQRTSALHWLCTEKMMRAMYGHVWSDFIVPQEPAQRSAPLSWPLATVSFDQGSD